MGGVRGYCIFWGFEFCAYCGELFDIIVFFLILLLFCYEDLIIL